MTVLTVSCITNHTYLNTAQNRKIYKTEYVESLELTQALKFYMSSAPTSHDIFHVWLLVRLKLMFFECSQG